MWTGRSMEETAGGPPLLSDPGDPALWGKWCALLSGAQGPAAGEDTQGRDGLPSALTPVVDRTGRRRPGGTGRIRAGVRRSPDGERLADDSGPAGGPGTVTAAGLRGPPHADPRSGGDAGPAGGRLHHARTARRHLRLSARRRAADWPGRRGTHHR